MILCLLKVSSLTGLFIVLEQSLYVCIINMKNMIIIFGVNIFLFFIFFFLHYMVWLTHWLQCVLKRSILFYFCVITTWVKFSFKIFWIDHNAWMFNFIFLDYSRLTNERGNFSLGYLQIYQINGKKFQIKSYLSDPIHYVLNVWFLVLISIQLFLTLLGWP